MKVAWSREQSTSLVAEQETPLIVLESDKASLRELELRLETKLVETKAEIIRWTIGASIFQTILIAALLLKLVH